MRRRVLLGSLFGLSLFSGAVIAEAEHNYATVTTVEETTARVAGASADDGGLTLSLVVHNTMAEPLRLQFVHLRVQRERGNVSASVPYKGIETLAPGTSSLRTGIAARQFEAPAESGETVVVEGYLAVEVYNGYRFEVPLDPAEVTL